MIDIHDTSTHEQLLKQRVVILNGEIDESCGKEVIMKLLFLQHEDEKLPIHLFVNSPGGGVTPGFAIIDTIDNISPPVFTYCCEYACALAASIVAHGAKTHRSAMQKSRFSLCLAEAPESTDADNSDLARTNSMLVEMLAFDTGNPRDQIERDLAEDKYLDARSALAYNLVDRVVDEYPEYLFGI